MEVFISWSGELSKKYGEAIHKWLPSVIQAVDPYFTPDDIEKGARWSTDISSKLEASKFGIFCLTNENLSSPWLHFEAGAISKMHSDSAVCSILFGIESADVTGPLNQFQMTQFAKEDILKFVKSLNNSLKDRKLDSRVLEDVFEMWWPKLDESIKKIKSSYEPAAQAKSRDQKDMIEEILDLTRMLVKTQSPNNVRPYDARSWQNSINQFLSNLESSKYSKHKTTTLNHPFSEEEYRDALAMLERGVAPGLISKVIADRQLEAYDKKNKADLESDNKKEKPSD